jgi:hypothetical protein
MVQRVRWVAAGALALLLMSTVPTWHPATASRVVSRVDASANYQVESRGKHRTCDPAAGAAVAAASVANERNVVTQSETDRVHQMGLDGRFQELEALLSFPTNGAPASRTSNLIVVFILGYYAHPSRFSQESFAPEIEALLVEHYWQIEPTSRRWMLADRRTYQTRALFDLLREDLSKQASVSDQDQMAEAQRTLLYLKAHADEPRQRAPGYSVTTWNRDMVPSLETHGYLRNLRGHSDEPRQVPQRALPPIMQPGQPVNPPPLPDTPEQMLNVVRHKQELNVERLTKALLNTDQANIENDLTEMLDKVPPTSQADIALFLARRGDKRGAEAMERLLSELPSAAQLADQGITVAAIVRALAEAGDSAAYDAIRNRLIWSLRQPTDVARDGEVVTLSHALSAAPPELHINLIGIEPPQQQPLGAATDTALRDLINGRAATEALVTDMSSSHLQKLIDRNDLAAVRIYIAHGFDMHSVELGRMRPAMLETLLQGGADPNVRSPNGNTPLHSLCLDLGGTPERMHERMELVNVLIAAKADVNARNQANMTPLMLAVQWNQPEIVRTLLQHGADVSAVNEQGRNAMQIAIDMGAGGPSQVQSSTKLQKLLRDAGAWPEFVYRHHLASFIRPVLSLAAAALVLLGFGWLAGTKGFVHRLPWAIVWPLYALVASVVISFTLHWWRSPHPGGEPKLLGYLIEAAATTYASAAVLAAGVILLGLQAGQWWSRRQARVTG